MVLKKNRYNDKDLLIELVKARFKLRYNNSVLGFVWVLLKPLLYFLILYFIFTAFKGTGHDPSYAANLFLGIILFTFLQEGVVFGMNSLLDMSNIILKINFPRGIAIISSVLMAVINLGVNFIVIIILSLLLGFTPNLMGFAYLLFIIFIIFLIIYAVSLVLSILMVRLRDLTHIIDLIFQLLFWGSAIFYSMDEIQGSTGAIIRMNPIAILIDAARKGLILGQVARVDQVFTIFAVVIVMVVIGQIFFNKNIRKVAEHF